MLNWLENIEDPHIREGAIDLQSSIHELMIERFQTRDDAINFLASGRNAWRHAALTKISLVAGRQISGTVLEIGAGSGWASSLISNLPEVEEVYCLDYDPVSVQSLMPTVQKSLGADRTKIKRVIGSYNAMPLSDEVDFIISIGAIHHAESLFTTLTECHKVLKPGGWMFATEPALPDTEMNGPVYERYKKEDPNSMVKYGRLARHEENSDHYYRLSEYIAAGYAAKFDVYPFVFDMTGSRQASDQTFANRQTANGFHLNVLYPYFAPTPAQPQFDTLFLMLQKPENGGIDLGHRISA